MKNKKIKYLTLAGSLAIATGTGAQVYLCQQCPANTYSNGRQCISCGEWEYSDVGSSSCTAVSTVDYKVVDFTTGGEYASGTLQPGFYLLVLGGGNGGTPVFNGSALYYLKEGSIRQGYGAQLQYLIKIENNTSYTIASGADGSPGSQSSSATGGGGGSWATIGGTTYIAGGGGGAVAGVNSYSNYNGVSSQGGYGGGIGAGGGGGDDDTGKRGTNGGNSGNYIGGAGNHDDGRGGTGGGEQGGLGGAEDKYSSCGGDRFTQPNTNDYGGVGGLFSINNKCWSHQIAVTGYSDYNNCIEEDEDDDGSWCVEYEIKQNYHTFYVQNGGDGKASHSSNTTKFNNELCYHCAKLYKVK